jgi:hypothetical protein
MSAEERTAACEKGYADGIGAMAAKESTTAGENGYADGIGAIPEPEAIVGGAGATIAGRSCCTRATTSRCWPYCTHWGPTSSRPGMTAEARTCETGGGEGGEDPAHYSGMTSGRVRRGTRRSSWRWWPPYSGTIAFELVRLDGTGVDDDRFVIRVILNEETLRLIPRMSVDDEVLMKEQP